MSERAPYSRVYWGVPDDPKFHDIYADDHHFATWTRLLLVADQAHPASAHIPAGTRRASVTALSAAGLIDLFPGSRYRVHGLNAERQRRALAATSRGKPKPVRVPDGDQTGTGRSPNGTSTGDLDETRRDETSQAEQDARALDGDGWDDTEGEALTWLARHGCALTPGNGYHRALIGAVEQHGINAVIGMFDRLAEAGVKNGDAKGFVFGAKDALDARTRPNIGELEREDREEERGRSFAERVAATKRRNAETWGKSA